MSSAEFMNSSDDDEVFIIESFPSKPGCKKVDREVEEELQLGKRPNPSLKTSKKRKISDEKTNTNVSARKSKLTMSNNLFNQGSEKLTKIREDSYVKNESSSVDSDFVSQKVEQKTFDASQGSTSSSGNTRNGSHSKSIDYFKSNEKTPEKGKSSIKQTEEKKLQISPVIQNKIKKFLMPKHDLKTSPQKNCQRNVASCSNIREDSLSDDSQKCDFSVTALCETNLETITDSSVCQDTTEISTDGVGDETKEDELNKNIEILCDILKNIINDELKKQMDLKNKGLKEGKVMENLLSDEEVGILQKFCLLEKNPCKLYVRMLCRKKGLHRVSAINFKDITADLEKEFKLLEKENFVKVNSDEEDLPTLMNLLNVSEITQLCKRFDVSITSTKKKDRICLLIKNFEKQRSVIEWFEKTKVPSRMEILRKKVKSCLGMYIKLNESIKSAFQRIFLLFSFPHYYDLEEKRISDQLYTCLSVRKQYIKFPQYDITPTVIFQCRADFLLYEKALLMNDSLNVAIESKNHEVVFPIANEAKNEFKKIMDDHDFQKRFLNLQPFLMKFSAGNVYARILTKYCTKLKKIKDNNEVIDIMKMLLKQNLFLTWKRGQWYEILSQAFSNIKKHETALKVLLESQKDSFVNEVQKFNLQLKGQVMLKKIKEFQFITENELDLLTVVIREPPSIEISSKILEGNKAGYKSVMIEESEGCKSYMSVEERALSHYKLEGFTKGYHGENYIIKTIYFLLFNDIIYGPSPPGAFQTAFQQHPLDFYSKYFYSYRKESIDSLFDEMCQWTKEVVRDKLKTSYENNFDVHGVMNWGSIFKNREKNLETLEKFVDFLECITMPVFVKICHRFLENFKVYSPGFPDLTLWDPESKKCKFVEVKGPNDKLSPAQRIWLNFLKVNGIECEVCYIKCNLGRKPMKKK